MAAVAERRASAARLRSETDTLIQKIAQDSVVESGLAELVLYGEITIVVVNGKVTRLYIKSTFEPKLTPGTVPA